VSASPRCDGCAVDLLPDSSFCHACGKGLRPAPGALAAAHGEHKRITVLFVDAFGSIGLGDRLDAEQWHDIVESFFSVVSIGVQHFGGTIDRLTGEGIKVLFGAPVALENHATQACHAALHIATRLAEFAGSFRSRAGVEFSVRMGLNSGEAVFGRVGGDPERVFTSQGHTAAIAARMQQLAGPGQIYLSEHTAALVADYFEMREMGSLPVRNARTAVRVFELLGAREHRSRLDAARSRGLSPFIGREAELTELDTALQVASTSGHRVVGIVGEPGVGKSRLVEEFVQLQREQGVQVHYTQCSEHARWIPFHTTLPFLRDALNIAPADGAQASRARIESILLAIDASLATALPVLFTVLGLSDPAEAGQASASSVPARELARVIRSLVEQRDAQRPSIFILDDQQWMDAGSDAVFGDLVHDPARSSVLVLVTYRRGHRRRWMRDPDFSELSLRPLDRAATLQLVRALLGSDRSLATLPQRIAERAAGNPFFVEETVLALVDSRALEGTLGSYRLRDGEADVVVPGSLHAVLAARIDQLGERQKSVLQMAAVIGPEFSIPLLAAISGYESEHLAPILHDLEAADFVSALGWGDEAVYLFRHPLLRETVYRSLLRDHRAQMHRAIVRELQRLHGERAIEHAAQIALHAEASGEDLEAARWHRHAARNTVRWDPLQGLEHWRRVLACTGLQPGSEEASRLRLLACEAIVRLGFHQGLPADEAEDLVHEGRASARRLGDLRTNALLVSAAGGLRAAAGDMVNAIAHHVEAVALAEQSNETELAMTLGARLVLSERIAGRLRDALRRADAMLAAYRSARIANPTPGLVALRQLELARAVVLVDRGALDQGAAELTRIIAALRNENAPMVLGWALALTAATIRHSGDDAPGLVARVEEARILAQHLGVPSLLGRAISSLATVRLCQERWEEARICAEEACETMLDVGHSLYLDFNPKLILSFARFGLGDRTGARTAALDALHEAFARGARLGQIDAMLAYSRILVRYGTANEQDEGLRLLRHGLAMVRETGARSRAPFFWFELAGVARRGGDEARAMVNQRRGARLLIAMNAVGHLRRAAGLMTSPPSSEPQHDAAG